nr:hypothetical protein [Tanacetum cinerariifolium]
MVTYMSAYINSEPWKFHPIIDDSNPEEDEEDPKEDPIDYPANGGDNDDNESSDDDDDDDDVEKDGEVDEEEEHLAPVDPSVVPIVDHSMSQTERQKEKVEENASNKRKWEGNYNESLSQQNKGHKVPRAHTA